MACGGSRTDKGDAIRAVFGAPVEIVLKREALKYAPHLGRPNLAIKYPAYDRSHSGRAWGT